MPEQVETAIEASYASGARYLNSIASFLNDATKLAALARKPANSGLFTQTLVQADRKGLFRGLSDFAAPLASEIMMERKKIAAAKAKKEISVSARIEAYLEKQTDMTAMDAPIIALLTGTHNALLAQEAAVLERQSVGDEVDEVELAEAA